MRDRVDENSHLQAMKFRQLFRTEPPANFRMARKSSRAGAGRVHKNPLELCAKWQFARGIKFDEMHAANFETLKL